MTPQVPPSALEVARGTPRGGLTSIMFINFRAAKPQRCPILAKLTSSKSIL